MDAISLFELNEHVKRVVALNFPQAVWVKAEIAQINVSKGHHYIELIENQENSEEVVALASAILWAGNYRKLQRELGKGLDTVLRQGQTVQLKVRPDFNERYGLKLMVEEVDVAFTLGQMAVQRQAVIDALHKKQLIVKNRQLPIPIVLQKIAIISSARAAGLQDFVRQLNQNPFAYAFETHLFEAAMQGQHLEEEITHQFKKINRQAKQYDLVVVIRGGGAKLDLSGFDSLGVGETIAKSKVPVWTGIGHDIDDTVADMVAHRSLKTPTAVAAAIVQHNQYFETDLIQAVNAIGQMARNIHFQSRIELNQLQRNIQFKSSHAILKERENIVSSFEKIKQQFPFLLQIEKNKLVHTESLLSHFSIEKTLERGYAILKKEGKVLKNVASLKEKDLIEVQTSSNLIEAKIEKLKP